MCVNCGIVAKMFKSLKKVARGLERGAATIEIVGVSIIIISGASILSEVGSFTASKFQVVADNGGGTELISSSSSVLVDPSYSYTPPPVKEEKEECETDGHYTLGCH